MYYHHQCVHMNLDSNVRDHPFTRQRYLPAINLIYYIYQYAEHKPQSNMLHVLYYAYQLNLKNKLASKIS